jgi:hypothetical protein
MSASSLPPRFMRPCTGLPAPPPPRPPPHPRTRADSSVQQPPLPSPPPPPPPPTPPISPQSAPAAADAGSAGRNHPPSLAGRRAWTARGGAERGRRELIARDGRGRGASERASENETKGNGSGSGSGGCERKRNAGVRAPLGKPIAEGMQPAAVVAPPAAAGSEIRDTWTAEMGAAGVGRG